MTRPIRTVTALVPPLVVRAAAAAATAGLALGACSGLDTGNANDVTSIKVAVAVGPGSPIDQQGNTFTIETALANVRDVDLYLPDGATCDDLIGAEGLDTVGGDHTVVCENDHVRARGPWLVDLVAKTSTPDLPEVPVLAGTYRRIDVRFDPGADGATIAVTGTFLIEGRAQPFAMTLDFSETLRFEGTDVVATRDAVAQALLTLDPSGWFASMPLAQCAADGDFPIEGGIVRFGEDDDGGRGGGDDDACEEFDDRVRDGVRDGCELEPHELGDDGHHDGEPLEDEHEDDDETPPPPA